MRKYRGAGYSEFDQDEIWFERDARKRALLKQATPGWADHDAIRAVYRKCDELNRRYPATTFVVHHLIPIAHPRVCGLHVADNLKVVSLNVKKKLGRKFKG